LICFCPPSSVLRSLSSNFIIRNTQYAIRVTRPYYTHKWLKNKQNPHLYQKLSFTRSRREIHMHANQFSFQRFFIHSSYVKRVRALRMACPFFEGYKNRHFCFLNGLHSKESNREIITKKLHLNVQADTFNSQLKIIYNLVL